MNADTKKPYTDWYGSKRLLVAGLMILIGTCTAIAGEPALQEYAWLIGGATIVTGIASAIVGVLTNRPLRLPGQKAQGFAFFTNKLMHDLERKFGLCDPERLDHAVTSSPDQPVTPSPDHPPRAWPIVFLAVVLAAGGVARAEEPAIVGPERVPVGRLVRLEARGIVPAVGEWIVLPPSENFDVIASGQRAYFSGERPGTYNFAIVRYDAANGQQRVLASVRVIVGDGEDPPDPDDGDDEDPDDGDDENPPLPPPGSKYRVAVIFEKDDLDEMPPAQAILLSSLTFRERLETAGHKVVALVDQHIEGPDGERPSELAKYFDAVEGDTLPRICLEPIGGGQVIDFPLPVDEDAVFELLQRGTQKGGGK